MCDKNCDCTVCSLETLNKLGLIDLDSNDNKIIEYQLKAIDLFDQFVKSGLGS
jgi:hypothetical protein